MTMRSRMLATSCWLMVVCWGPFALAANPPMELHQATSGSLWRMAQTVHQSMHATPAQAMLGLLKANPHAFTSPNINALKRGVTLRVPDQTVLHDLTPSEANAEVMRQNNAWKAGHVVHRQPKHTSRASTPRQEPRDLLGQPSLVLDAAEPSEVAAVSSGKVQLVALAERADDLLTNQPSPSKQANHPPQPVPQEEAVAQPTAPMTGSEAAEVVAKELHGPHHPTTLRLGDRAILEGAIRRSEERQLAALKALQVQWEAHVKRLHEAQVETTDELADFREAWEQWLRRQPNTAQGARAMALGGMDGAASSSSWSNAMMWVVGLLMAVLLVGVIRLLLAALIERRRRQALATTLLEDEAVEDSPTTSQRGPRPLVNHQAADEGDYDLLGSDDGVGATLEAARAYARMGDLDAATTTLATLDPERMTAAQRLTFHEVAQAVSEASVTKNDAPVTSAPKTVAPAASSVTEVGEVKVTDEPAKAGDEPVGDEDDGSEDHGGERAQSVERPSS